MLFQNTSVTRGTGAMLVTATGMETEMGRIATMLSSVTRVRSPLQRELDSLTKVLGVDRLDGGRVHRVVGLLRGVPFDDLVLLGTAMACRRSRPACPPSSRACCRSAPSSSPRRARS